MSDQKIPILLNLVAAFLGAVGQYFYKRGSAIMMEKPLNPPLLLGVLMFVGVMGLFVVGYKMGGRISVVYPFYATTFIWGALIGVFVEKEPFHWPAFLGLFFVILGLSFIASQAGKV